MINEQYALVDSVFWHIFLSKPIRIYKSPSGLVYLACEVYECKRLAYVLILLDNADKLESFALCEDLDALFGSELKKHVSRKIKKGLKKTRGKRRDYTVSFSKELNELEFLPGAYPDEAKIHSFEYSGKQLIVLIPSYSDQEPEKVLTGFDLHQDEKIQARNVKVISEDIIDADNERTVICLIPARTEKLQLSKHISLSVSQNGIRLNKQDAS